MQYNRQFAFTRSIEHRVSSLISRARSHGAREHHRPRLALLHPHIGRRQKTRRGGSSGERKNRPTTAQGYSDQREPLRGEMLEHHILPAARCTARPLPFVLVVRSTHRPRYRPPLPSGLSLPRRAYTTSSSVPFFPLLSLSVPAITARRKTARPPPSFSSRPIPPPPTSKLGPVDFLRSLDILSFRC